MADPEGPSKSVQLQEANSAATDLALLLYKDYVRRWLLKLHGYECQEAEGNFMLAFFSPIPAIKFCIQVGPLMQPEAPCINISILLLRQHKRAWSLQKRISASTINMTPSCHMAYLEAKWYG